MEFNHISLKQTLHLPLLLPTGIKRKGIEALFGGTAEKAYLQWPGIGTFLAESGKTLTLDTESENIPPEILHLFIYSEASGLIFFQRAYFLLHASAIKIGNKALVFAGSPGAGKSSVAAAYQMAGAQVIADDMVIIDTQTLHVIPFFPQVKIWPQTVKELNIPDEVLEPLYSGSSKKKFRNLTSFSDPIPLGELYVLERSLEFSKEQLGGVDAIASLLRYFPCPSQLLYGTYAKRHFDQCTAIAKHIPIWKLKMPGNFSNLKAFVKDSLDKAVI